MHKLAVNSLSTALAAVRRCNFVLVHMLTCLSRCAAAQVKASFEAAGLSQQVRQEDCCGRAPSAVRRLFTHAAS